MCLNWSGSGVSPVFGVEPRNRGGGGSEIRTHGCLSTTAVFKTAALNRSAIPPCFILLDSITLQTLSQSVFGLFPLPGHYCHSFVTALESVHRARLRIDIGMRIPHRYGDGRMPKE